MPTKGTTTQRGYGTNHQKTRRQYQPHVDRGEAFCTEPICLHRTRWIPPGTPWDLAHNRTTGQYRGPAHRRCNRAEAATYRNTRQHRTRKQPPWHSQTW